jgi:hypothetical protein
MRVIGRVSAQGGFNVNKRGGAVHRLYNMRTEGLGKTQTEEFHEKTNPSHPFKTLSGGNLKSLASAKIKAGKMKKYISLSV